MVTRAAKWTFVLLGASIIACRAKQDEPALGSSASATSIVSLDPLPRREEVVARADALAVDGARTGGPKGAQKFLEAAQLRERVWRLEGREPDALEALELYKAAAALDPVRGCDAKVDLALLEGELKSNPARVYEALYAVRTQHEDRPCAKRAASILTTLAAFRPSEGALARLTANGSPAAPQARTDASGTVVSPKLEQQKPSRITQVEHYEGKDAARVVVFVTHPALFDVGTLAASDGKGPRLYVDIKGATYKGKPTYGGGGLVEQVRLGQQENGARVVLDLATAVHRKVFYVPEPFRLVIDISKEPPPSVDVKKEGPRAVRRIVLDPGHGGDDPGAVGAAGLREKDVALDIAHRAAPLIARELGVSTLLTRDTDTFVPLDERVARANAFGADLFISIHCNASETGSSKGIMTFVLDTSRDDLAARVAARENASSPAAAAELANVMSRVLDAGSIAHSTHFGTLLQRAAVASIAPFYPGVQDLGVRSAGFYVLAGARMPAVLFEASFISHGMEETRLDTGHYRQKIADAIVNAIRAYRDGV